MSLFVSPFAMPKTFTKGEADDDSTIMELEYESYNTAVSTVDVVKQIAVSISREPSYKNNAAAVSTIFMLEQDLSGYKQTLVNLNESVEECNSSDLDVFDLLSKNFKEAGHAFLDTGHALCDARKQFGYARSEEPVESAYHYLFQRLMNARSLLKAQHNHFSQVEAHKLAFDESRHYLETLIENAYYTPMVVHMIILVSKT